MISFKHKGNIRRLQIKSSYNAEKLMSAICRLFPIKGFILGFKSETDVYYDVQSFLESVKAFENMVVEIVSGSDHADISFSSDNVSSFVPPQERSTSPFLSNRLIQVTSAKDVIGNYTNNTIVVFIFNEKLKDWIVGKITQLSAKYSCYDIIFLYQVIELINSGRQSKSLPNSPFFSIFSNKTKLCQIKITPNFTQQIEKIFGQIQVIQTHCLEQNSLVGTLKRIQKLDQSPSFLTRNIEDVISKDLILQNLHQMFQQYLITQSQLQKLTDLVNNNFMEFCQLFCQNLGDTDYQTFKKQIQGHLQRYRVLLNSLLEQERPISRQEKRFRGNSVQVLKIEQFLQLADDLDQIDHQQLSSIKKLILQQNKQVLSQLQKYQKKQTTQIYLLNKLKNIIQSLQQSGRPISRCIPRGRTLNYAQPCFNMKLQNQQQFCQSQKSFGDNLNSQQDSKSPSRLSLKFEDNTLKTLCYWQKDFNDLLNNTQLLPNQRQTLHRLYRSQNPLIYKILSDYIASKSTHSPFTSTTVQICLKANKHKPTSCLMSKFNVFKLFVDGFVKSSQITAQQRNTLIIGFASENKSILGALQSYFLLKSESQLLDTLKLVISSSSLLSQTLQTFMSTVIFFLKHVYQYPNLLQHAILTFPSAFRGICQKQMLTKDHEQLLQNMDILNSIAFGKRFYSQIHQIPISLNKKQNIIKQFQKGNEELYQKLITLFQNNNVYQITSSNKNHQNEIISFKHELQKIAQEFDTTERVKILEILTELSVSYNNPAVLKCIKYYDNKQKGFCSIYELYRLMNQKEQFIDNLKVYLNHKQPGLLSQLPLINESPVLKKRYKQKNDELLSIISLLKTSSEQEVSGRLKQFQQKQRVKVVRQTLSGLGLTGEKIKLLLQKHSKQVMGLILRYLNTNNKQQLIFAIEPYLMMLLPQDQKRSFEQNQN